MTLDERYERAEAFVKEFRDLVHKHAGTADYQQADPDLLAMLQDRTSVFNPYVWSV